jgi:predicted DNA-binding transcriptional regulator AlpA
MARAEVRGYAFCSTSFMTAAAPSSRVRRKATPTRRLGRTSSPASRPLERVAEGASASAARSTTRYDNPQFQLMFPIAGPAAVKSTTAPRSSNHPQGHRVLNDRIAALDQILTTRDVVAIVGHHRCTLFRWMSAGQFPHKHAFRGRKVGWLRSDIEKWLAGDKLESLPPPP